MFAFTSQATTLSGTVRDSEGAVVCQSPCRDSWDQAGSEYLGNNVGIQEDITVTTDSVGKFSLGLAPGPLRCLRHNPFPE